MAEIKIAVEVKEDEEELERYGIEDKVFDALKEYGLQVVSVRVHISS